MQWILSKFSTSPEIKMSISKSQILVGGLKVEVTRKDIKNVHLSVCPPDGRVRMSVPNRLSDENVRLAVANRLSWIKRQQAEFRKQNRETERTFAQGESHYFEGRRYLLKLDQADAPRRVEVLGNTRLRMSIRPQDTIEQAEQTINDFYRSKLRERITRILPEWSERVGATPSAIRIRKMKTKWGSCNSSTGSILLNLELAKKPPKCTEYVLVHELIHLHIRPHNEEFAKRMNDVMPDWRSRRDLLQSLPLAHEDWTY